MQSNSLLDPKFRYINAASTDIRKTFRRARKQMEQSIYPADVQVDEQELIECMHIMRTDMPRSN
jgi:hypothetical protein